MECPLRGEEPEGDGGVRGGCGDDLDADGAGVGVGCGLAEGDGAVTEIDGGEGVREEGDGKLGGAGEVEGLDGAGVAFASAHGAAGRGLVAADLEERGLVSDVYKRQAVNRWFVAVSLESIGSPARRWRGVL